MVGKSQGIRDQRRRQHRLIIDGQHAVDACGSGEFSRRRHDIVRASEVERRQIHRMQV